MSRSTLPAVPVQHKKKKKLTTSSSGASASASNSPSRVRTAAGSTGTGTGSGGFIPSKPKTPLAVKHSNSAALTPQAMIAGLSAGSGNSGGSSRLASYSSQPAAATATASSAILSNAYYSNYLPPSPANSVAAVTNSALPRRPSQTRLSIDAAARQLGAAASGGSGGGGGGSSASGGGGGVGSGNGPTPAYRLASGFGSDELKHNNFFAPAATPQSSSQRPVPPPGMNLYPHSTLLSNSIHHYQPATATATTSGSPGASTVSAAQNPYDYRTAITSAVPMFQSSSAPLSNFGSAQPNSAPPQPLPPPPPRTPAIPTPVVVANTAPASSSSSLAVPPPSTAAAVSTSNRTPLPPAGAASAITGRRSSLNSAANDELDQPIDLKENVAVVVRIRPIPAAEAASEPSGRTPSLYGPTFNAGGWAVTPYSMTDVEAAGGSGGVSAPLAFERVFNPSTSTQRIYELAAKPIVDQVMCGFNGTIFAYGQTGSGKTHTILGEGGGTGSSTNPGLIPLAIADIFRAIDANPETMYLLRVSYMEIYNEQLNDLFNPTSGKDLQIREVKSTAAGIAPSSSAASAISSASAPLQPSAAAAASASAAASSKGDANASGLTFAVSGLTEKIVTTEAEVWSCIKLGMNNRKMGAGSETLSYGFGEQQQKETKHINLSLTQLKSVITSLSRGDSYIPYRNSCITKLLKNSLGGNARTVVVCTVSIASKQHKMTKSTLVFGAIAKKIRNYARMNEVDDDDSEVMLKQYRKRIEDLEIKLTDYQKMESAKAKIQRDYQLLQNQIADLKRSQDEHSKLESEVARMSALLMHRSDEAARAKEQLAAAQAAAAASTQQKSTVNDDDMRRLNEQLSSLATQNARLEQQLKAEQSNRSDQSRQFQLKMAELKAEEEKARRREKELHALTTETDQKAIAFARRMREVEASGMDRDVYLANLISHYEHQIDELLSLKEAQKLDFTHKLEDMKTVYDSQLQLLEAQFKITRAHRELNELRMNAPNALATNAYGAGAGGGAGSGANLYNKSTAAGGGSALMEYMAALNSANGLAGVSSPSHASSSVRPQLTSPTHGMRSGSSDSKRPPTHQSGISGGSNSSSAALSASSMWRLPSNSSTLTPTSAPAPVPVASAAPTSHKTLEQQAAQASRDALQLAALQRELASLKKSHANEKNELENRVSLYELQLREFGSANGGY